MGYLEEFIAYLEEQVENRSIYVWGGQGQKYPVLTEEWIRKKESRANAEKAIKVYRNAVAAGKAKLARAFDCSGLGMYWIQNIKGLSKSDMTANGMKGLCTLIQKSHLKKGDWVFRTYKTGSKKGRAYHIGYVADDNLNVIEARGRAYGVVKRSLNASGSGYWNAFGRPEYFAAEIDAPEEQKEHAAFNRNLKKGMKGDDVRELQKLLNAAGDNISADGAFGSRTFAAVKTFQKRMGLKTDGIAGEKTVASLANAEKGVTEALWMAARLLKRGTSGADVMALQNALIKAGYSVGKMGADGRFGQDTETAVRAFQMDKGLKADGVAGEETVTALGGKWRK